MAVSTQEYARLLKVPYAISREIDRFEKNRSAIKKDYENEKKNIQEAYDSSEATSSQVRERLGNEADARYQNWMQKLDQYKKKTESTRQQFNEILTQAVGTPVQSAGQAIGMLEEETQQRLYRRKGDDNRVIIDICRWENQAEAGIEETNRNLGQETLEQRKREIDIAERRFSMEHSAHESIRDQLRNVREVLRDELPNATEKISWSMPTYWMGHTAGTSHIPYSKSASWPPPILFIAT